MSQLIPDLTPEKFIMNYASCTIFAFIFLLLSCREPGSTQRDTENVTIKNNNTPAIIFLGNSLTEGTGLAPGQSMPSLIAEKIIKNRYQYRVINAGRSGDTTAAALVRLPGYLRRNLNIKILVLELGSNDCIQGVPLSEMENNFRTIIQLTRKFNPAIVILLFQMKTLPWTGGHYAGGYEMLFGRIARLENIQLLSFPLQGIAFKPELNQPDGIHPTAAGTRIYAENVWKDLKKYL